MREMPCPEMLKRPRFSFVLLTLLGETQFVKASCRRIEAINSLRLQEWREKNAKIRFQETELAEKKRQDELEQRLGWGYSYPYLPPQNTYVVEYKGMQITRPSVSTGRPVLYNGEIVQVS